MKPATPAGFVPLPKIVADTKISQKNWVIGKVKVVKVRWVWGDEIG